MQLPNGSSLLVASALGTAVNMTALTNAAEAVPSAEAAEEAVEEAAAELEEPPQAVKAAAAPQTAAADRNERRVILRIIITPSILHFAATGCRGKAF